MKLSTNLKTFVEFDVNRIWPLEQESILEKCHQIEYFFKDYDLSIIKIKLKKPHQAPRNKGVINGNKKGPEGFSLKETFSYV